MDISKWEPQYTFRTKTLAEEFCMKLRQEAGKYDIITVNDILREVKEPIMEDGFHYGYHKKEIRKLKAEKDGKQYVVRFPAPGRMIRDRNGYWTTETTGKGGG